MTNSSFENGGYQPYGQPSESQPAGQPAQSAAQQSFQQPAQQSLQPDLQPQSAQQPFVAPSQPSEQFSEQFRPSYSQPAYQEPAFSQPPAPQSEPVIPAHAKAESKQSRGSGLKTFVCGFLGALLACSLTLGGYTAFFAGKGSGPASSTYIGTQDSSIIEATEEGVTLAEAVAAKVLPSVVAVYNYQNQPSNGTYGFGQRNTNSDNLVAAGMGSGVVISDDGYIVTNYHVVDAAQVVTVSFNGEERDAEYIGGDSSSDVAVIKVKDASGLQPADIGDSDTLRIGEWVMTVGAPLGLEQSVATGVVSATNRSTYMDSSSNSYSLYSSGASEYTYYPNMIQTDAVINPGNSGGALVDADGKLIGINAMISSYSGDYAGVGFAIPVNYALGIAKDVIDGKEPTHAMLGVSISSVNGQNAQRYGFSANSGAYINAITPGTGAADSGLKEGDIITAINGHPVTSATDVTLEVRSRNVGDTVTVTVDRDGKEEKFDVVLSSDEIIKQTDPEQNNNQGNGNGIGNSNGNGSTSEEMRRFLKLFGF